MSSNLVYIKSIAAEKGRSKQAFLKQAQPWQSINTNNRKKELLIFVLRGNTDAPSAECTLRKAEDLHPCLHLLDIMEVVLKHGEVLCLESLPTADDL